MGPQKGGRSGCSYTRKKDSLKERKKGRKRGRNEKLLISIRAVMLSLDGGADKGRRTYVTESTLGLTR